jgi:ABC-type transport system involved in cytochrome c biogenesis ATPase subunit
MREKLLPPRMGTLLAKSSSGCGKSPRFSGNKVMLTSFENLQVQSGGSNNLFHRFGQEYFRHRFNLVENLPPKLLSGGEKTRVKRLWSSLETLIWIFDHSPIDLGRKREKIFGSSFGGLCLTWDVGIEGQVPA